MRHPRWRRGLWPAVAVVLLGLGATACTPPGLPDPIAPTGLTSVPSSPPAAGTVVIGLDGSAGRIAGLQPVRDRRLLLGLAGRCVAGAALGVRGCRRRRRGRRPRRDRRGHGDLAGPVHRDLHGGPEGVLVRRHADHRRGLLLPAGSAGGAARHRRPGRLSADQRDPLAGCRKDRRGGVQQAVPGLADAVLAVAAEPPDEGFPGRLGGRAHAPTCRCPRTATR